jgi:hypothetical protein
MRAPGPIRVRLPALVLLAVVIAGCGSSSSTTTVTVHTASTAPVATTAAVAAPGCGSLCQQAAPSAGNQGPGACAPQGCLKCPQPDCFVVLSPSAHVAGGAFSVRVQCVWTRACNGGLTVWKAGSVSMSDRLAGSEFTVPAGETTDITVGLTPLGNQVVGPGSSYRGDLYVVLQGAGAVDAGYPQPTLLLQG